MPRKPAAVPSYKLHKPSGQARVILDGKHFYLGPFGSEESHEEYARLIARRSIQPSAVPNDPIDRQIENVSVSELIVRYWAHAETYYRKSDGRPTTEVHCIRESVRRLRKLFGRTPASNFGPMSLKIVRQHMIGEGLARSVINGYIGRIKRLFKWAVAEEMIHPSVIHGLQAVTGLRRGRSEARETSPIKPAPQYRIDAVVQHVRPQIAAMIQFQLLTGCRPGEVCIIRSCDIDMTGRVWIFRPHDHKTEYKGHSREIFIGPKAQEVIKPWLRTDLAGYLFQPREAEASRDADRRKNRASPITPSQSARQSKRNPQRAPRDRYDVASYRRAISRGCEIAFEIPASLRKAPRDEKGKRLAETMDEKAERTRLAAEWRRDNCWHPHQLRHNAATNLRKEFGVELARIILGHATAFTTEIYAETDRQQAIEVIGRVG